MPTQDRIESFIGYFRRQLAVAARLSSDVLSSDPDMALRVAMHRKVLYCVMLDCLAGVRYHGRELGSRRRFIRLLRNHTAWPAGHLVSVPILYQRLGTSAPAGLRAYLQTKLDARDPEAGNGEPLAAFDTPLQVLLDLADTDADARVQVEQAQHFQLVYRYRNFLIHEFREPGYAMESFGEEEREPLYHSYVNDHAWRLLYPADFFHRLVAAAVTSLHAWFIHDGLNPYDSVPDSSGW